MNSRSSITEVLVAAGDTELGEGGSDPLMLRDEWWWLGYILSDPVPERIDAAADVLD